MNLPLIALGLEAHQLGLVAATALGFGFGFVLERAGFGRSTKLAAQFYLYDMTVFKVMFGAIVTALLGLTAASGLGLVDLGSLSAGAASETFIWPMLVGGLLLGAGFIISGYCPGTSIVASASGNLDGVVTLGGVLLGSLVFAESFPLVRTFNTSGAKGHLFLYQWLGLPAGLLAVGVMLMAVGAFLGVERLERLMTRKFAAAAASTVDEGVRAARAPRRLAFGWYGAASLAVVATLFVPVARPASAEPTRTAQVSARDLARRVIDSPWKVRVIDLRGTDACRKSKPVPGSECTSPDDLGNLALAETSGGRALVLVTAAGKLDLPAALKGYRGEILVLSGGYAAWKQYALTEPKPPSASATPAEREAYAFRASLYAALANQKLAPAAPIAAPKFTPKKKKKGGGCG